ncbi:MAG: DUF881 domain-containing protein [Clostridiales bacterium]|nr:DUF881 domain-containing protein [Clostridiales bacterium]
MKQKKTMSIFDYWQLPLAVVFLCFGLLIVAQYRTNMAYSSSLETQSYSNLSVVALGLMDRRGKLQEEINGMEYDLWEIENSFSSGSSLASTIETRINTLQTAIGAYPVCGSGISVSITSESSQLIAYDLIDIINELFVSGAEAVSINNQRITVHTQIADLDGGYGNFRIVVNGETLLSPVVIRAIGDPSTLEIGLMYSGGIIDALRILHIYPIVKQEENINIPAARYRSFQYAAPPAKEE